MTDDEIREAYRRLKAVVEKSNKPTNADDYHYMVNLVSTLSSVPYTRVFQACLDEDGWS
jgi:hypothetical protein